MILVAKIGVMKMRRKMMNKFTDEEIDTILNGIDLLEAEVSRAKMPCVGFKNRINSIKRKLYGEDNESN